MLRRALFTLLAGLALAGAALAAPLQVQDERGKSIAFDKPPARIVTLIPSLTELVCALGACERLVGVDNYSNHPAAVKKLPRLGGIDDTSVEAIVALRPDVVLLSPASRLHERLETLGLKVVLLETRSHADLRRVLLELGRLLGVAEPLKVWQRIDSAVDAAAASVPPAMRGLRVYYEVDAAPYAAGEVSFIGETLARMGLRNIVGRELGAFPKLNPEYVVRADPQIIMLAQRNAVSLDKRPGWPAISALRERRLCVFTPDEAEMMGRPGPRLDETAQLIARCLRELGAREAAAAGGAKR